MTRDIFSFFMSHFWQQLPKPFFCLAPMADVTDVAFRCVIAKYSRMGEVGGGPHVMWTEFVSADALAHSVGRDRVLHHFRFSQSEHPIVAQIFGATPENFRIAASLVRDMGFDGVDINMGCPEKNIQRQGACAALIQTPSLAKEIIHATKEGAGDMPVSVKTRIGYNKVDVDSWIPELLSCDIAALTVHGRTKKEMSKVPAHWDVIGRVVQMAQDFETVVIGNGDVVDIADARQKAQEYGVSGVMLGRAIFGNPWLFDENRVDAVSVSERLRVMVEHTKLYEKNFSDVKNFSLMKKHYVAYVSGFSGARQLRQRLMEATCAEEVSLVVDDFLCSLE
ncbi:MAG: tRNA-dihydrouridine synthase [Candidatus Moranbacteria bacterium]|nr:tRNA-dihydrouridine synthase [Candidatus Moranbacteria bacterium]